MSATHVTHAEIEPVPLEKCGYALSLVLGAFAAIAWLARGGVWEAIGAAFTGRDITSLSQMTMLFVVLAILSVVVQFSSNVATAAARQALAFGGPDARADFDKARLLMIAGGAFNAVSLHHAIQFSGFLGDDLTAEIVSWIAGGVLAFYEPGQYWVGASLNVKAAERRASIEASRRVQDDQRNATRHEQNLALARASSDAGKIITGGAIALAPGAAFAETAPPALPMPRLENVARAHAGDDARVAEAVRLKDRYRRELGDGWRAAVAAEMKCSERTVSRYLSRAAAANKQALALT